MYIAFKWLVGLAVMMWATICCIDVFLKTNKEIIGTGLDTKPFGLVYKNHTTPIERKQETRKETFKHKGMPALHCTMFIAGALVVLIFNKKNEIISFTKRKIDNVNIRAITKMVRTNLKRTAIEIGVAISTYSSILWETLQILITILRKHINGLKWKKIEIKQNVNFELLKKFNEIGMERKNLGQLLIAAIHENKTIRMQYQLETMAKNRLVCHIENTQKQIKENRSRYVNFQQLYLVTHQENMFLKARIRKLTKEKEEAEKNLMGLMNEIYKSKNNELKAYCSRFIVRTKDNLLNSDMKAEIQKFLQKSPRPSATTSRYQFSKLPDIEVYISKSWPRCTNTRITEILQEDDSLVPVIANAPRLKGLPGECVWTVKDKDGIIEKLYEYDYESDFENGETIRRIRQYSVYYDKDCLLDFSNSKTLIHEANANTARIGNQYLNLNYPLANERFLTGSEVFQKFLQTNKNSLSSPSSRSPTPSLLCG